MPLEDTRRRRTPHARPPKILRSPRRRGSGLRDTCAMPGTVLVVEDDLDIVALLRDFLDDAGFGVVVAGDADGALDALARESVDCALVDVMLPGTSGFELCRRVRAQDEHLPLLFLSARGDDSAVSVYVRKLREKLEEDPGDPRILVTVWGVGYRFDPPVAR